MAKKKFSKRGYRPDQSLEGITSHSGTKNKIQASEAKFYISGFLKKYLKFKKNHLHTKRSNQGKAYSQPRLSYKTPSGFITSGWPIIGSTGQLL